MSKIKNELFRLVKAMDSSEKGYFKKHSLNYSVSGSAANNYLRLFDALDGMEEYDEAKIKKAFGKDKFIGHLSVQMNYLYQSLLKCLRNYSAGSDSNLKLLSAIQNAAILFRKGQYAMALRIIEGAKLLAGKNEYWGYMNELIEMENTIYSITRKDSDLPLMKKSNLEKENLIEMLQSDQKFIALNYNIRLINSNHGIHLPPAILNKIKKYGDSALLKKNSAAKTSFAKNLRSSLKCVIYQDTGDLKSLSSESQNGYRRLKENPILVEKNPRALFVKAHNLAVVLDKEKRYEELKSLIAEISSFESIYKIKFNPRLRGLSLDITSVLNLVYYINTKQFEKGIDYIHSVAGEIEKYKNEISGKSQHTFHLFSANLCLLTGRNKEAINHLNHILIFGIEGGSKKEITLAKYLLFIAIYETQWADSIERANRYEQVNRLFAKGETIAPLHELMKSLQASSDKKAEIVIIEKFRKQLLASPNYKFIQANFDFEAWTEKKTA